MKSTLFKIFSLLTPQDIRRSYILLGMIIIMGILDMVGVASIMPFIAVMTNPEVVKTNKYLAMIYVGFGFTNTKDFLFFLGVFILVVFVASVSFKALTTYAMLRFSQMLNYSLSKRMVKGYLEQSYDWFLNRHSSDIGKTILSEVGRVNGMALMPMILLVAHGTVAFGILVLLIIVNPLITSGLIIVFGSLYSIIYLSLRGYLGRLGNGIVEANKGRFKAVHEAFGGIKDIKVSGLEGVLLNRFDKSANQFAQCQAASQAAAQLPRFGLEIVIFGGMLLTMLYLLGPPNGIKEALPLFSLYAFASYRLMPAMQNVYVQLSKLRFAGPALDLLHAEMNQLTIDKNRKLKYKRAKPLGLSSYLRLECVKYTYPSAEQPSLNNLNIEIAAKTTIGLVGVTGSGKTTTVDLFLGLLSPNSGNLIVDDVTINQSNIRSWQSSVGYVPQHIYLIDDSVTANIAFGIPSTQIDHEAVKRAAIIANLDRFVTQEMPNGYATLVGERGVRLSGGQRQRIGIARALYHDPPVLILDEATSALDNITEQAVMDAVHNIGHRKTIILIAHRLNTVRYCDNIFLLERGTVTDSGTYNELMEKNENFSSMVNG
jgi:ABC-type bacteriocin/lantibiotic exporter with double-glycine peptidase domain